MFCFQKLLHQNSVRMLLELITQYFANNKKHEAPLHAVFSILLFLPLSYAEGCKVRANTIVKGKVINVWSYFEPGTSKFAILLSEVVIERLAFLLTFQEASFSNPVP